MSCEHDCPQASAFPLTIENRPGLDRIDYRIGDFNDMRETQLHTLNSDPLLERWTHRGLDDPGIAMLEANAIVGDILSFYQNHYANEAYLRTATWRESVSDLVVLGGYRLAPGLGGEATFCLSIKGEEMVQVPKGAAFKAKLADRPKADIFESNDSLNAFPQLSEFSLYRLPLPAQSIQVNDTVLEIKSDDPATVVNELSLSAGDQVMLVPNSDMFDQTGRVYTPQAVSEIVTVKAVTQTLGRVVLTLQGKLQNAHGTAIRAFKVGRRFRHFGYNATRRFSYFNDTTNTVTFYETEYDRSCHKDISDSTHYAGFRAVEMPIDSTVKDLAVGSKIICRGTVTFEDHNVSSQPEWHNQAFAVVKTLEDVKTDSVYWGNVEASVSVLELDRRLIFNGGIRKEKCDVRKTEFYEVIGPEFEVVAGAAFSDDAFSEGTLHYYGTYAEVQAFCDRRLLFWHTETEKVQQLRCVTGLAELEAQLVERDATNKWMWPLTMDEMPVFPQSDFSDEHPLVKVYGNVLDCTQGQTEKEVVLGSGDQRQVFQTFSLPKAPLTYLLNADATPAHQPELEIYVDGIKWQRVNNLYGQSADAQVYVVREDQSASGDAEKKSFVQFGDGLMGRRLPSGTNNISAVYRTGVGAVGKIEIDKKPSAASKISNLQEVILPLEVVGGAEAELADNARVAAPQKLQSLDRIVGLADLEAEAMTLPSASKVRAQWVIENGSPLARIIVLMNTQSDAALVELQDNLNRFNRCRGAKRHPILAQRGLLQYVAVQCRVGYLADRKLADIEKDIQAALGMVMQAHKTLENSSAQGLFAWQSRQFGQGAHRSQISHAIQSVQSVAWVEIDMAQTCDLGDPPKTDPSLIASPVHIRRSHKMVCPANRILALFESHFDCQFIDATPVKECD